MHIRIRPIILLTVVIAVSHVTAQIGLDLATQDAMWFRWKLTHQKQYANDQEENERRRVWTDNVAQIMRHNIQYDLGLVIYSMGLNAFSDLSWEEFHGRYLSQPIQANEILKSDMSSLDVVPFDASGLEAPPAQIDWRINWTTPVRNQGACDSCWAFASVGSIEGQYVIKYNSVVEFSKQQLVDCSQAYGTHGCVNGSSYIDAYRYVQNNDLYSESVYPYTAKDGKCTINKKGATARVQKLIVTPDGSENSLQKLVYQVGPTAVAIDTSDGFHQYKSGIYSSTKCSSVNVTHAVLVVGYGSDHTGQFWILKNSWDATWGEKGYARLARNRNNMCGVATYAVVPELV